ncbi:LemA family protein [Patescibacteria group bacterium]|nr:LemA family protein [Patescibacteria group bacterium]MBU1755271.1 LemA family protein [Patescibacteria group bacterium]
MNILYIILGVLAVIILWAVFAYNGFVAMVNRAKEAWSDIEVQMKRRYDLIPNLVETVKGYATHERETLDSVTKARTEAMGAQTIEDHAKAENQLTDTLKSLFAVAESYPDLKANTNFLELQRELANTEDKIMASRRFYNSTVQQLNTALQQFPGNIIGGTFNFKQMDLFELTEEAAREPVKVSF